MGFWRVADRLAAWPPNGLVRVDPDLVIAVEARDYVAAAAYRGLYERAEEAVFRRLLPPGPSGRLVVDVGANVGIHTALFSRLVGPSGHVIAFEPAAETYAVLDRLVRDAPLGNVTAYQSAVGATAGRAALHPLGGETNTGLASLRDAGEASTGGEEVPVVRLDSVAEIVSSGHVDLLKVDVEGFEADVLAGAGSMFDNGVVRNAVIEVSPHFGPIDYAVDLVARVAGEYRAFAIREVGTLRRSMRLEPLTAAQVDAAERQFNLLLSHRTVSL